MADITGKNFQELKGKLGNSEINAISLLNMYCLKEKTELPSYSDEDKENDLFVAKCILNGFTGFGMGKKKKFAKESAAASVAQHFKVYDYFSTFIKNKKERENLKNPIQILNEICNRMKLNVVIHDEQRFTDKKTMVFIATIDVDGEVSQSYTHSSKKIAKAKAAELMLNATNNLCGNRKRGIEESSETESSNNFFQIDLTSDDDIIDLTSDDDEIIVIPEENQCKFLPKRIKTE